MGMTAENVAERWHVTRADMDAMAAESHRKAYAAQQAGKFKDEIIPITVDDGNGGQKVVTEDEGIRPGCTAESLSHLKPCFKPDGIVTAATSSQMTDGSAFIVLMARETAEKLGYAPIAKFVAFSVVGVEAAVMGIGPMKAVPKVMKRTGLTVNDMDVIEINEAFASQALACIRELKMPVERVNPNGGAMALGHPLGATGSVLLCKAISELKRTGGKYALITMCIGGGQGAAGIFEMEGR
jgi:acetyl-CoA acyltransferase